MNRKTRRSIGLRIPVWGDKPVPDHQVKDSGRRKNPKRLARLGTAARRAERTAGR